MSDALTFDEELSRRTEELYSTPDVVEQRRAVMASLMPRPGERVIDIGVGPGFLAAQLAEAVGEHGLVCGVDVSDSMLALTARRTTAPGSAPIELHNADACAIPYPDGSFDAAVSTQVFEYLTDLPAGLAELRRVLRPGGRVLLLDTDWDSIVWHSRDRARMERVLTAWEEHAADPRLPRTLGTALQRAGFAVDPPRVLTLMNVGHDPHTFGAGLLELVAGFVPGRNGVSADEVDAWAAELRGLGSEYFLSLNRYLFTAIRTG